MARAGRRSIATTALALVALVATTPRAAAAPTATADPLAWLDPDAPLVVRIDPPELERLADAARTLGAEATVAAALASLTANREVGFDPLAADGWRAAGFVAHGAVFLQLAAIDAAATDRAYRARERAGGQWGTHGASSPPLWRSRLVARAATPAQVVAAFLRGRALERAVRLDPAQAAAVAAILGVPRGAPAIRDLGRLGVVALGAVPALGALAFVRIDGDVVAIDLIAPYAGDALEWRRDRAAILAALGTRRGAPAGARAALARPGLTIWASAAGLVRVAQAWRTTEALRARFGAAPLPDLVRPCANLASLDEASFRDLALHVTVAPAAIALELRLRHAGPRVAEALATRATRVLAGVAPAAFALRLGLASVGRLRRLPRPALLARGWDEAMVVLGWCGHGADLLAATFAGPELAGLWLDELAAALPAAATVLDAIGDLGVGLDAIGDRLDATVGVVEAHVAAAGVGDATAALDAVFGPARTARRPRAHRAWGEGPLEPYLLAGKDGDATIGAGFAGSRAWRLRPGAARAAPADRLVELDARVERIATALARGTPWARLAAGAAARFGALRLVGTLGPDALTLRGELERRP
jgi:hypothetical protein